MTETNTGSTARPKRWPRAARNAASGASEAAQARPPATNRGVTTPDNQSQEAFDTVLSADNPYVFDYYRASTKMDCELIAEQLYDALVKEYGAITEGAATPLRFYDDCKGFYCPAGRTVARIATSASSSLCNVIGTGPSSPIVASVLRSLGDHSPSRVDSCIDVEAPGLFRRTLATSKSIAAQHGIKRNVISSDDPDNGWTIYLGSRSSRAFVRIYQPGLKRYAEDRPDREPTTMERQAVRFELEFKPDNPAAKQFAAKVAPQEVWAVSRWTSQVAREVLALDVRPIRMAKVTENNTDRALRFMCKQYSRHLKVLLEKHDGDIEAFGADILDRCGLS